MDRRERDVITCNLSTTAMSVGNVRLDTEPVDDRVRVTALRGRQPEFEVGMDADGARALADQLVAAADALDGHWQPGERDG